MREQIEKLVQEELDRANAKFPQFASRHEGHSVIREEIEETKEEMEKMEAYLDTLWKWQVRAKHPCKSSIALDLTEKIRKYATNLAAEAIQVAAMALKYQALLKPDLSPDAEEEEHL